MCVRVCSLSGTDFLCNKLQFARKCTLAPYWIEEDMFLAVIAEICFYLISNEHVKPVWIKPVHFIQSCEVRNSKESGAHSASSCWKMVLISRMMMTTRMTPEIRAGFA